MWPRVGQYQGGEEQFSRCPGQETLGALHRPHYPLAATHHYPAERCPAAEWHQCGMYTKPESTSRQQLAASNILCRTRNSRKSSWGFVSLSLFKIFSADLLLHKLLVPASRHSQWQNTLRDHWHRRLWMHHGFDMRKYLWLFCVCNGASHASNYDEVLYNSNKKGKKWMWKNKKSSCLAVWEQQWVCNIPQGQNDFKECLFPLARLCGLVTYCVCLTGFPHRKSGKESAHRWRLHTDEHLLHFIHTHPHFSGKHTLEL